MVGLLVPVDSRFRGNDGVSLPSIFIAMTGLLGITMALSGHVREMKMAESTDLRSLWTHPAFEGMTVWVSLHHARHIENLLGIVWGQCTISGRMLGCGRVVYFHRYSGMWRGGFGSSARMDKWLKDSS